MLNTLPAPLTREEIDQKIASGEFKVTRLKTRKPRKAHLIMTRIGGSSISARFIDFAHDNVPGGGLSTATAP